MSDPDQEEMRRKRLARLSAMSGGGGREGGEAGGGVHLHGLHRHEADLGLGLERLVPHHGGGAGHQY